MFHRPISPAPLDTGRTRVTSTSIRRPSNPRMRRGHTLPALTHRCASHGPPGFSSHSHHTPIGLRFANPIHPSVSWEPHEHTTTSIQPNPPPTHPSVPTAARSVRQPSRAPRDTHAHTHTHTHTYGGDGERGAPGAQAAACDRAAAGTLPALHAKKTSCSLPSLPPEPTSAGDDGGGGLARWGRSGREGPWRAEIDLVPEITIWPKALW